MKTEERRKYVRLNKIYPIELKVIDLKNNPQSSLLQGFTRDISYNGVCVEVNDFQPEYLKSLENNLSRIILYINIPFKRQPVKAVGRVAWAKKTENLYPRSYLLGINYECIDATEQKRIINYAKNSRSLPFVFSACIVALIIFLGQMIIQNFQLRNENILLGQKLERLYNEQSKVIQQLDKIEAEKFVIAQMLKNGANEKEKIKNEMADIEKRKLKEDRRRNVVKVNKLIKEKANLEERLNALADKNVQLEEKLGMFDNEEKELTDKLQVITNERLKLSDKSMDLMCQWLESAQNNKTGLVPSYDKDEALLDVGYTYDQALSVFNFLYLGQEEKAKQILDFFKNRAQKVNDCFANAYDVANGGVCEYIVHSGPSIYLGLAMIKYESITHKQEYREVVNNIGQWLIALQGQRQDGALPGGPDFQWTSTEQNIAAYVFFKELFKISNDQRYAEASDKVALWLKDYGYNCKLKRFNRGKDDRMIATDIIALSILALGPEKLQQMGVDIEELVNCVEDNCKTSIVFEGLSGRKTTVTGYDFCAPSSIGRKGTISIEWTSQMIVAFRELARFYENKNDLLKCKKYNLKADYYLGEMEKLLLVRTFFGKKQGAGLPYSTDSGVPTGHGWHTPDSSSISAAGTNFAIFAKEEYNIFRI